MCPYTYVHIVYFACRSGIISLLCLNFFFYFDSYSIIVTTAQYLSPALHKNFTDGDFDFKVRDFD